VSPGLDPEPEPSPPPNVVPLRHVA
jgi:hypothetical protein